MEEFKKHTKLRFEIESDLKTLFVPVFSVCGIRVSPEKFLSYDHECLHHVGVRHPECLGDTKTIHHPEVITTDFSFSLNLHIYSPKQYMAWC